MKSANTEAATLSGEHVGWSFGGNWRKYLRGIDDEKIGAARNAVTSAYGNRSVAGETFLDAGSGSGLFSLAAAQLGATHVTSIDPDPACCACAAHLRATYKPPAEWQIEQASLLDANLPSRVGTFSRVYCWGVVPFTGNPSLAIARLAALLQPGGLLCLGLAPPPNHPRRAMALKRTYNRLPRVARPAMRLAHGAAYLAYRQIRWRDAIRYVRDYSQTSRGMTFWRDNEDWLGALPIEFHTHSESLDMLADARLEFIEVRAADPGGMSEYIARRACQAHD